MPTPWKCAKKFLLLLFCICISANLLALTKDQQKFINEMVKQQHFKRDYMVKLFSKLKKNKKILASMTHPYEAKPWYQYRKNFMTEQRIELGAKYWIKHKKVLAYAEKHYGVPAQIIIGIIGVETQYGGNLGSYSVLDSLNTLAFYYPRRAKFFRNELKNYFLMTREQHLNPTTVYGSYAGAMGLGQFMPTAYRALAVDYSHDNKVDLSHNHADAICSVANYFAKNGWKPGQHVAAPVKTKGLGFLAFLQHKPKPFLSLAQYKAIGVSPKTDLSSKNKAGLIELQDESAKEYWLTFSNFNAIMAYNPRISYAMAVFQLSEAIKKRHGKILLAEHKHHRKVQLHKHPKIQLAKTKQANAHA